MSRRKRCTRNLGRTLPAPLPIRTTVEWVRFEYEREPCGVFKAEANLFILQARRLAILVRAAGIPIVERLTRRIPGKVRWEDRDQVAVLTYRDTARISMTLTGEVRSR